MDPSPRMTGRGICWGQVRFTTGCYLSEWPMHGPHDGLIEVVTVTLRVTDGLRDLLRDLKSLVAVLFGLQ